MNTNGGEYKSSESKIINVDIEQEMTKSFMDYSMSVIVSRALPDVRDGLKPVHRRILYTMFEAGLTPEKKYLKCAATVGDVLGKYHPHGDASVYDALVRLAQKFSMRYPLVDGHGNFGSPDGDGAAAYRYTEAKMSKIAPLMLSDIGKETVAYQTNYDDRLKEPVVLPGRYPNLLVNGSIGIAVGMATNIPPHNLTEVIDGLLYYIDNPDADWTTIMEYIKGPDFPTGAKIMGRSGIRSAYATGKGTIVLRAETHLEKQGGRDIIVADAMPYMTNKRDLEIRIAELLKEKRLEGVHAAHDYSGKDGIRFVVELNKNANPDLVLSKLYKYTDFQKNFSINMLALVDGIPKTIGIIDYLREYLKFQVEVITNRTKYDLKKALERAHILRGLAIAVDNVDEVLEILKTSDNIPHGRKRLEERFSIDEIQSEAIVQMTIGRITGLERQKILDELAELETKIAELEGILADKNKVLAIIKEELTEIKRKFGDPRRTVIEDVSGEVDDLSLIPEMDSIITYTNVGYVKRVPAVTYKSQNRGGKGVLGMKQRDEDFVAEMLTASTHEDLLFFTDKGRVFRLKGFEIPEGSRSAKGTNIVNLLPLTLEDKITAIIRIKNIEGTYDPDYKQGFIFIATRDGIIKRTKLTEFENINRNGKYAIILNEGDEIAGVVLTDGNTEMLVATKKGRLQRFIETEVRSMGRMSRGVKGIKFRSDEDIIVGIAKVREAATVLTITEKGFGRRAEISEYTAHGRRSQGLTNYKPNEKTGDVAGIKVVDIDDDVIIISDFGMLIRVRAADIRQCSRTSIGVRIMRLKNDDEKVVSFTRVDHEEDAVIDSVDGEVLDSDTENSDGENVDGENVDIAPANTSD